MEITLKVVLSADANFLAVLQGLGRLNRDVQKSVTQTTVWKDPVDGTESVIDKTEKKTRKVKEINMPSLAEGTALLPDPIEVILHEPVQSEHTLDSLRAIAVPLSKAGHKDAIKAKLTEMGYEGGLASLQPKDFQNFFDYLQTLS